MGKTSDMKCPNCGKTIPENAVVKKGFCHESCYNERLEEIRFAEETVERVHGYKVKIPLNDPDPWWYVVG